MAELSEKELSAINDCLKEEELLVKKFKMLAEHAEDDKVKNCFKEKCRVNISKKVFTGHFFYDMINVQTRKMRNGEEK